ncbi:MAG TPA: MBL fold metallo-hydrolase [Solirubrobacterales bacterium]|nr:MBL fold metallo-hydrolase [Solirubrobacterales bacterium]
MRIHHLNCGSMCPYGGRFVGGVSGRAEVVCHTLLVEGSDSLVLVDTGLGTDDMQHRHRRLGVPFTVGFRVVADLNDTALHQIRALGHDPADVRHIVVTHLDLDHAGGLPDFPEAEVHVFEREHEVAMDPSLRDRARYRHYHFDHGPKWATHGSGGDDWFGFESTRILPGAEPEILMIPLPGHSRGHTAIAVRDGDGWLLHCGDAYFNRREMETPPSCPPGLRIFQRVMAADDAARRRNQERLRELAGTHGDEVRLFSAHDHVELKREQERARPPATA